MSRPREVIRRSRLFGGRRTAQEIHAEYGFRGRCLLCSGPPVIRVKMFMTLNEFVSQSPQMAAQIVATNPDGPFIPTTLMTFGPMVKFSDVLSCLLHRKELEVEASKAPSYVLVEIDRGPSADRPVVQVPRA